jgi:PST family polysaccharide transporter
MTLKGGLLPGKALDRSVPVVTLRCDCLLKQIGPLQGTVNSTWIDLLPMFARKKLDGRHNLQRLIPNTGWLLFDKILRLGVGLFVSVWTVRYLGPVQLGTLSFALAFATLFSVFATLGLDGIVVRELVQTPESGTETLGAAFLLKFAGGVVALLVSIVSIILLRPTDTQSHWMVAIVASGMIFQSFDVIDYWFQARTEAGFAVYARSAAFLAISAFKVFLIVSKAPLMAFAWAASLELALAAIGLVFVYQFTGQHLLKWRAGLNRILLLLRDAWPLALSGVSIMIYMKIDQIMLGEMLDSATVGIYSAAVRISEVWYFIPLSIVASVSPSLMAASDNPSILDQRLAKLFKLVSIVALSIAVPMTFFSNYATKALYGNAYAGAGPILAVHIWSALFVFLGVAQGPWNIIEGLTKLALLRTSVGAVSNIVLNLLLIPRYGGLGAAIATTISYALSAVILNAFSAKTRKIFVLQLASIIPVFPSNR